MFKNQQFLVEELDKMTIRFLSTIEKWKDFSNLSLHPIELDNKKWKSVEHYFQFKKYENSDPKFAQILKEIDSSKEVKKLSLKNKNYPKDWEMINSSLLKRAGKKKFETYPELKKLLFSTGDEELIEANPDNSLWGEGKDGKGGNFMGKILMELRKNFQKENEK